MRAPTVTAYRLVAEARALLALAPDEAMRRRREADAREYERMAAADEAAGRTATAAFRRRQAARLRGEE